MLFRNICKLLRIYKIKTTAYHPESNGTLERSHRERWRSIFDISYDQSDWDEWIPYAIVYNTTPHTATGYTPVELVYGRQAELPIALAKLSSTQYNLEHYVQELKERLRAASRVEKENLKEEKEKAKRYFDKDAKAVTFKVGDKILVYDKTLRRADLRSLSLCG